MSAVLRQVTAQCHRFGGFESFFAEVHKDDIRDPRERPRPLREATPLDTTSTTTTRPWQSGLRSQRSHVVDADDQPDTVLHARTVTTLLHQDDVRIVAHHPFHLVLKRSLGHVAKTKNGSIPVWKCNQLDGRLPGRPYMEVHEALLDLPREWECTWSACACHQLPT